MLYMNYYEKITAFMREIAEQEADSIRIIADKMATTIKQNGLIHIFGCGHSHILAEEAFYRAGGLVPVNPLLDSAVMLHEGAVKSSEVERMEGYASLIFSRYRMSPRDLLFVWSVSGLNGCPIDMALEGKKAGIPVVAVTSADYSCEPSRHSSGKHLDECADYVIYNHVPHGDAIIEIGEKKIAPVSTILCSMIWNMLIAETAELLSLMKEPLPYFVSGNISGGKEQNKKYIKDFQDKVKLL